MNSISANYNVSFQGKPNPLLWQLTHLGKSRTPATKGHYNNVYYKTNINEFLRHPETAMIDACSYLAMQNVNNFGHNSNLWNIVAGKFGKNEIKEVITENPIKLKNILNKEFETLEPINEAIRLFRGISGITDQEYQAFKSYKKGTIQIPDKGFAYMTRNFDIAKNYVVEQNFANNAVIFEVDIPEKSRISELNGILPPSRTSPEWPRPRMKAEAVTPAGAEYEVTKDSELDKNGILHVFIKYLNRW